ncbi:hypothetical protein HPB51_015017 [Rhipicephalus microplus]|uniref:DDE Tnp4 domain-containing protein n=1 Tax=Rhipicephalus microplus TaxID=6941 RepID=A0A9J6EHF7_RHIMP|nr:hypothetical protein HPB51_015017 [Rhipicephalus microplus]
MAPINTRALAELEEIDAKNELIVVHSIARRRRRRLRRVWVRQVFLDRAVDGDFHNLLVKLRLGDAAMFHNFMRMSPQQFDFLENLVRPLIEVRSTHLRSAISAAERLAITLRFLATGNSYQSLSYSFRVGKLTISQLVPKQGFSINLMASCDASYKFTSVYIGCYGRESDGGVFAASQLGIFVDNGHKNLPAPCALPNGGPVLLYVFVADDAFPLKKNLMKPYPGTQAANSAKRIYNYRLSRARRREDRLVATVLRSSQTPLEAQENSFQVTGGTPPHHFPKRTDKVRIPILKEGSTRSRQLCQLLPWAWRSAMAVYLKEELLAACTVYFSTVYYT